MNTHTEQRYVSQGHGASKSPHHEQPRWRTSFSVNTPPTEQFRVPEQPRALRDRAYTTPQKTTFKSAYANNQARAYIPSIGDRRPGTPVPSLSNSETTSPQSSKAQSPITPTFAEQATKLSSLTCPFHYKTSMRKSNKDISKRDISRPMPSPVYSIMPLTLDIAVDKDAYETQRLAPAPTAPLPRNLETSYMEWDEDFSKLDKMKKSMRLGQGNDHKKGTTPTTLKALGPRSPDRHLNATPRVPGSVRTTDTQASRHHKQDQPGPVSNFSRPKLQASPVLEQHPSLTTTKVSCPLSKASHQTTGHHEPTIRSPTTLDTHKPLPEIQPEKGSISTSYSRTNLTKSSNDMTRHATAQPARHLFTKTAPTSPPLRATTKPPTTSPSTIEHTHAQPRTQPPTPTSFYTYHVTRPIHTSTAQTEPQFSLPHSTHLTSNTYSPVAHSLSTPTSLSRRPSTTSSKPPSRHVEGTAATEPKAKLLRTWMHGIAKKASIPNLRKRVNELSPTAARSGLAQTQAQTCTIPESTACRPAKYHG